MAMRDKERYRRRGKKGRRGRAGRDVMGQLGKAQPTTGVGGWDCRGESRIREEMAYLGQLLPNLLVSRIATV